MKLPPYVLGVVILCWGWLLEMFVYAMPMAILLESRYYVKRRWVFSAKEFYLLADVTILASVVLIAYFYSTGRATHFLYAFIQIIPLVFYPLLLAFIFSTTEKLTLDVFFYSLRGDKLSTPGRLELGHMYVGVCLISMSSVTDIRDWFIAMAVIVLGWVLWVNRPQNHRVSSWIIVVTLASLVGLIGQKGLRESHLIIKQKTADWLVNMLSRESDPFKTKTALGRVGELKLSDKILFRVERFDESAMPVLLQEASYDLTLENDWLVLKPAFRPVEHSGKDEWRWLSTNPEDLTLRFYPQFDDDRVLLPVPRNAIALENLDAVEVTKSLYGSIKAVGVNPESVYNVSLGSTGEINGIPGAEDLHLSPEHRELFDRLINTQDYQKLGVSQRIEKVVKFFEDYKYSLYQPERTILRSPLENFLETRKAGHCEYFATATTLMLRALNVPARYVVGYSLNEYSASAGMHVVRSRHAHAWVIAHDGNQWHVVDTTPSVWLESEAQQSNYFRPLIDLVSNAVFRARLWWSGKTEQEQRKWFMFLAAVLGVFLIWRMMGSPQISIDNKKTNEIDMPQFIGMKSPLYEITQYLTEQGFWRQTGETLSGWFERIDHPELLLLLPIHYKWRFDPQGVAVRDKRELAETVTQWMQLRGMESERT